MGAVPHGTGIGARTGCDSFGRSIMVIAAKKRIITVVLPASLAERLEVARDGRSYQAVWERALAMWIVEQERRMQ